MVKKTDTIIFGGGCFWCTEAVFKLMKGVVSVVPGYAGGHTKNPTYEGVSRGDTGHAEAVRIGYDPSLIDLKDLLTVFFGSHDPTTLDRQPARPNNFSHSGGGPDVGTQYRSIIFYTTEEQKNIIRTFVDTINASHKDGEPVVTEVVPLPDNGFYEAEEYHKNYFANNPANPYCTVVINPKLEKVEREFAHLLKKIQ